MTGILAGCNGQVADDENNYVAIVNGEGIFEDDYQTQLAEFKEFVQAQYGIDVEEDEELLANLENQALENLITTTLLLQESENKGITVSQSEVDERINDIKSRFDDDAHFEEALDADGLVIEELADMIREEMLIDSVLAEAVPDISISEDEISDEEIEEFYGQQKEMAEAQGIELPALEEAKPDVVAAIIQQKEDLEYQQAMDEFMAGLTEKSDIEVLL